MTDEYIRKQDVSDWLKQYGQDVLHGKYKFSLMYIWKKLMELPAATPKMRTAHWIDPPDDDWDGDWDVYECSCCGATLATYARTLNGYYLYCPKCGCYMQEDES